MTELGFDLKTEGASKGARILGTSATKFLAVETGTKTEAHQSGELL
jgi:hypothetical protein